MPTDPNGDPPAPRIVLVAGPGGAGRTTVAAATALSAGQRGGRTLLLTTEEAGVAECVLGTDVPAGRPAEVLPGLWAARTDPDAELLALADAMRRKAGALWEFTGAEPLDDDELVPLPGASAFALLRALGTAAASGAWETLVVDLPAVPEALHTLALPAQVRRLTDRLLPPQKQAARALRPMLAELAGVPMPSDALYAAADDFLGELTRVQALLESERTTVQYVVDPGPLTAGRFGTVRAALALHGLRLEAVVANRMLPTGTRDAWLAGLSGEQQAAVKALRGPERALPVREVPHLGRSPRGAEALTALAERAGLARLTDRAPATARRNGPVVEDRLATEGMLRLRLALPGARKEELGLVRRGDELLLSVGSHRRAVPLPSALRRCRVVGAAFERGELCVRLEPDPDLWPFRGGARGPGAPAASGPRPRDGEVG
ncbi:ArsA family ATPase [Streptomyces sp. TR06-5]|uniref:ArsA family ATPase n=1 Tax=unclassified Streptomyces TaxID=2593676 RepID=UPI00399FFFBF